MENDIAVTADFKSDFLSRWDNTKTYTLAVAEAMPEAQYGFKPAEHVWSFGGQIRHIAQGTFGMTLMAFPEAESKAEQAPEETDKAALLTYLAEAFDNFRTHLESLTPEMLDKQVPFGEGNTVSLRKVLILINNHITHHRAQAVVSLQINGIKPPAYVGW